MDRKNPFLSQAVQLAHVNKKHANHDLHPDLLKAYEHLMTYLQRDGDLTPSEVANYADTAVRAAKAFRDLTASRAEITKELHSILETGFPKEKHDVGYVAGLITQGPIKIYSLCPHHLLQVEYAAYLSYLPSEDGLVLGLSKLARIAKALGKRPVLQEQLASDIADVLHHTSTREDGFPGIVTRGSAVLLTGKHSCMSCRGVQSDALTSVTELRGGYWDTDMEQKFYQAISAIGAAGLR